MDLQTIGTLTVGAGSAGVLLENLLEHSIMDKTPVKLRPFIPVMVTIGLAILGGLKAGLSWKEAAYAAVVTVATAYLKHDNPATAAQSEKAYQEKQV